MNPEDFVILSAFTFVAFLYFIIFLAESKMMKIVAAIILVASFIIAICQSDMRGRESVIQPIVREVNMENVSVKGQRDFQATVRIIYKDGELVSIEAEPDTTIAVPPKEIKK